MKKAYCMALRYLAHSNGCDLVFASVRDKVSQKRYKAIMNSYAFDMPLSDTEYAVNPADAILVPSATKEVMSRFDDPPGS